MSLLDLIRISRLKLNTVDGNKPATYQDTVPQMRNVRFAPNISPGATYEGYIRFEQPGVVPGVTGAPPIPVTPSYLLTENANFLTTENDNNLIV
jgi:hypothetical protein